MQHLASLRNGKTLLQLNLVCIFNGYRTKLGEDWHY
jgi:hypothetical protein